MRCQARGCRAQHRVSALHALHLLTDRQTADALACCCEDRVAQRGRVWCSVGWGDANEDGVRCYTPSGDLLGKIHIPETVANLCFGGMQRNRPYICGSTSLYAVYTSEQGALKP